MRIGFDLDNTLLDTKILKYVFEKNNMRYYPAINWDMSNYPDNIRQEIFKLFKSDMMIHKNTLPFAVELIKKLKAEGHKIVVITARDKSLEKKTIELVHELFDVKCLVVGLHDSKLDLLEHYEIDLWIDDSPRIEEYFEAGISCIMISNEDTLYNHHLRNKIEWVDSVESIHENYEF